MSGDMSEIEMWHEHLIYPLTTLWGSSEVVPWLDNILTYAMDASNMRTGFSAEVFSELSFLYGLSKEVHNVVDTNKWGYK